MAVASAPEVYLLALAFFLKLGRSLRHWRTSAGSIPSGAASRESRIDSRNKPQGLHSATTTMSRPIAGSIHFAPV
jgi:hypothetical protein